MKRFLFISLFALLLASCGGANSSLTSKSASSSDISPLPAIQIKDVYSEHEFKLEEFPDITFRIGPRVLNEEDNLYVCPLYANDVQITQRTIDRLLFAYDVNKDGYRDLVFSEKLDKNNTIHINGFDAHNMKRMENNLGLRQYRMNLEIEEERLRARAYMASTISSVTFDYAELAYSEEKGLYFVWDNMYQFKDFKLDKITLDDENKTIINPTINESGINYALHANTDYIFEIAAPREDNPNIKDIDFYRQSGFDVAVGDQVLGVNKFENLSSENDVHNFRVNFTDRVKEFTYKFVIPCMSFSINITLED